MKIQFEISDEEIRKSIEKTGKLRNHHLDMIVNRHIDEAIKKEIRAQLKNTDLPKFKDIVKSKIENLDWNRIISDWFNQSMNDAKNYDRY